LCLVLYLLREIITSVKKSLFVVILLVVFSTYLSLYTVALHIVAARHIYEDPDSKVVSWRTGPSGSLFPWPKEPGMLEVLTKLNEVDLVIYRYLVKTLALVGFSILLWVAAGVSIFKVRVK